MSDELDKKDRDRGRSMRTTVNRRRPSGETASVKDYNLEACPPGYDSRIWDLVIAFGEAAEELGFRLRTNNRLAYALLAEALRHSRMMDIMEMDDLVGAKVGDYKIQAPTEQVPTWSGVVRLMMLMFWSDIVTIGREPFAWEQFTGAEVWQECQDTVVRAAISEKILQEDPEEPGKPRIRARRQLRKRRLRTPEARALQGYTPQVSLEERNPERAQKIREVAQKSRAARAAREAAREVREDI